MYMASGYELPHADCHLEPRPAAALGRRTLSSMQFDVIQHGAIRVRQRLHPTVGPGSRHHITTEAQDNRPAEWRKARQSNIEIGASTAIGTI
jgi:hypothetical protein